MKRKTISILAFTLAASVTLSACTSAKVVADTDSNVIESSYVEEVVDNKITSNDLAFMVLLEEYYKSGKTVEEILNTEDTSSTLYASALYVKLRETGLDDETIKKELFNVVTFGLVHTYDDGWKNDVLVHNLNRSLEYKEDAIIYYYPLALYGHLFDCKQEHVEEEGRVYCDKIKENLAEMNENVLFYNYLVENVMALDDYHPAKLGLYRILNSNVDPLDCLVELETVYEAGTRTATLGDSIAIFHLKKTVENEMVNAFECYYDLASFAHMLRCDKEHYQNEDGKWECEGLRKK